MASEPLLVLAKRTTNWTETELAEIVGYSRSSVSAILGGWRQENLSPLQRKALIEEVRVFLQEGAEDLEKMELLYG